MIPDQFGSAFEKAMEEASNETLAYKMGELHNALDALGKAYMESLSRPCKAIMRLFKRK